MGQLGPAKEPFDIVSIDTIGGFGGRRSTKKYLHLMVDHFTRYAYILTSASQSSGEFIKLIKRVQQHGKIDILLTDQFGGLSSNEFADFLDNENITHIYSAVDSGFSNGLNERCNQTLVNRIKCRLNEGESKRAWSSVAHTCVDEYNNTIHSSTGFTPNYLMNGVIPEYAPKEFIEIRDFVKDKEEAFENSVRMHNANKKRYDKNRVDRVFNIGDKVYIENGNKLNREK